MKTEEFIQAQSLHPEDQTHQFKLNTKYKRDVFIINR